MLGADVGAALRVRGHQRGEIGPADLGAVALHQLQPGALGHLEGAGGRGFAAARVDVEIAFRRGDGKQRLERSARGCGGGFESTQLAAMAEIGRPLRAMGRCGGWRERRRKRHQ
jgi:hypothetical protein